MATNPLKNLLRTDERVQANEFRREITLRPSARAGGQFTVSAQSTLPASQTSMGRMASSLAGFSGLLAQYSQFQFAKEQEAQRQRAVEAGLESEELSRQGIAESLQQGILQGQQIDERVVQQEMQTNLLETKRQNEEWEQWWQSRTLEQKEEIKIEAQKAVEERRSKAKEAQDKANELLGEVEPYDNPLHTKRQLRLIGASRKSKYAGPNGFLETTINQHIKDLTTGGVENIVSTREQAEQMVRQAFEDFLEEENLDPASDMGQGFISAVRAFNEHMLPQYAQQILDASKVVSNGRIASEAFRYSPLSIPNTFGPPLASESLKGVPPQQDDLKKFEEEAAKLSAEQASEVFAQLEIEGVNLTEVPDAYLIQRTRELIDDVKNPPKVAPTDVTDTAWFENLQALPTADILAAIGGNPQRGGIGGLISKASSTIEDATRMLETMRELGDHLKVAGEPLKKHINYPSYVASLENAIDRLERKELDKQQTAEKQFDNRLPSDAAMFVLGLTAEESQFIISKYAAGVNGEPLSIEAVAEDFPELAKQLEDMPPEIVTANIVKIGTAMSEYARNRDAARAVYAKNNAWFNNLTDKDNLTRLIIDISKSTNTKAGDFAVKLLETTESGDSTNEGRRKTEALGLSAKAQEQLRPLITAYNKKLDNLLDSEIRANGEFKDVADGQARIGDAMEAINDTFRKELEDYLGAETEREQKKQNALTLDYKELPRQKLKKDFGPINQPGGIKELKELQGKYAEYANRTLLGRMWFEFWNKDYLEAVDAYSKAEEIGKEVMTGRKKYKKVFKSVDDLRIYVPAAKRALDDAEVPKGKEEAHIYLGQFTQTEEEAESGVKAFTDPKGVFRGRITEAADRLALDVGFAGGKKDIENYKRLRSAFETEVREAFSLSVEPDRLVDIILATRNKGKTDGYLAYNQDHFVRQSDSKHRGKRERGNRVWINTRKDITLEPRHFEKHQPVIKGLPLDVSGLNRPQTVEDVTKATGISAFMLKRIATEYGFKSAEELLKNQYNHPYYKVQQVVSPPVD